MSNPINQNLKPVSQVPMGVSSTTVNSAALPNVDTDTIQKNINSNSLVKNANADNPLVMGGTMLVLFGALVGLMNKINDGCKGEKSFLHKIKNFGNRISDRITGHSFFESKIYERMKAFNTNIRQFVQDKIVERSDFLKTLLRTPTVPKNAQVLIMYGGTEGEVAQAAAQYFDKYAQADKTTIPNAAFLQGKDPVKLAELGFVKYAKNPTEQEIKEFIKFVKHPDIQRTMEICTKNAGKSIPVSKGLKIPFTQKYLSEYLPSFMKGLFERNVTLSEFANKLQALKKNLPDSRGLGKFLPRAYLRNIQAITFGLDGSKIGMAMQAFFLAGTVMETLKAEKGDKTKTFMENFFSNQAMYLTMALSIIWMHKFGGLKYLGMKGDATKLEAYRENLEELNKKADISSWLKKKEIYAKARAKAIAKLKEFKSNGSESSFKKYLELKEKCNAAEIEWKKTKAEKTAAGSFRSQGEYDALRKLIDLQEKGLGTDEAAEIKKAIYIHSEALAKNGYKDSSAIKEAEEKIMKTLADHENLLKGEATFKGGIKEAIYTSFKWAAKALTVGLEAKSKLIPKNVSCFKSRMINWSYYLKKGAGYPVRFIFFGFVIAQFFSKLAARGSHLIFGRPKHSTILDDEESKDEKPPEHKLPAPVKGQPGFPLKSQSATPAVQPSAPAKPVANIKQPAQPVVTQNISQPHPVIQPMAQPVQAPAYNLNTPVQQRQVMNPAPYNQKTMIASQEPPRTYIPSPVGVKIDRRKEQQENQEANAALIKANKAEKMVSHVLGQ